MAESFAFKRWRGACRKQLRKRIIFVLEGIRSQRSQRLDLAGDLKPDRNSAAIIPAPAIQGEGQLQRVEQRDIKKAHEPVVARVLEIGKRVEPGNALRRRQAMGF